MITQADIQFHTPADVDHQWGETYWMGLYVPEANLYGWVYMVFRAGTGAVMCDVEFIDKKSRQMIDARYVDIQNHLRIPARLDSFTLANGVTFEARSPTEYRLDYVGAHDTEIHVDVKGIHEPFDIHDPNIDPMAQATTAGAVAHSGFGSAYANHFDLTARVTGTVKVRGQEYPVNCLCTQDHSWGPRAERGMKMMAYLNAHFADDYVVQTIFEFDASRPDGQQHVFKHGYAVKNGKLLGGVAGKLRVDHAGIFPRKVARDIVGLWERPTKARTDTRAVEQPFYDASELYGIVPDDIRKQFDMREVIARFVDGSLFHEFKPRFGETLVTGWAYIWGMQVGILGNNGVLFSDAANKATQFMQLCDRDRVPLLFLHNVTGFIVGREYERRGITKDGAKMLMVQANVTVPKLSLLVNASQGAGNYAMAGRAWGPRFLYAWPNSRSATMGAEQAVKTLSQVRVASMRRQGLEPDPEQLAHIEKEVGEYFERTANPYHLTSELRDDGLIDPTDTRNTLGMSLSAALNAPITRTPGGILRI